MALFVKGCDAVAPVGMRHVGLMFGPFDAPSDQKALGCVEVNSGLTSQLEACLHCVHACHSHFQFGH